MFRLGLMGLRNHEDKGSIDGLFEVSSEEGAMTALLLLAKKHNSSSRASPEYYEFAFVSYLQHIEFFRSDSIALSQKLMKLARDNQVWGPVKKTLDNLADKGYLSLYIVGGKLHSFSVTDKELPSNFSAPIHRNDEFNYNLKQIAYA